MDGDLPVARYVRRHTPSPNSRRSVARANVATAFRVSTVQPAASVSASSGSCASRVRFAHTISYGRRASAVPAAGSAFADTPPASRAAA